MTGKGPDGRGRPFRPNKRLGQHFLKDQGVIDAILRRSGFKASDDVLEVGPGLGALTIPLAGSVRRVLAIEKDPRLGERLKRVLRAKGHRNVTLLIGDILRYDFRDVPFSLEGGLQVIGNLPYNISSPFLERCVVHRSLLGRAVLMFQREFASRLLAAPGNKEYGALSVVARYSAQSSLLLEVSREAFYPRPKVGSTVLRLDFDRPYPRRAADEELFIRVVKGAFAHRRKTLINSLSATLTEYPRGTLLEALESCAIAPRTRAEVLDIETFLSLSAALATLS